MIVCSKLLIFRLIGVNLLATCSLYSSIYVCYDSGVAISNSAFFRMPDSFISSFSIISSCACSILHSVFQNLIRSKSSLYRLTPRDRNCNRLLNSLVRFLFSCTFFVRYHFHFLLFSNTIQPASCILFFYSTGFFFFFIINFLPKYYEEFY